MMLVSEFFNDRARLRAQGKLPPGDPIVYDARDTPLNGARFKAFNKYVVNSGQNHVEDDFADPRGTEFSDQEDRVEYAASKPSKRSIRIKFRVSRGGEYGNTKRHLFTNTTRDEKLVETISTGRVDRSEKFIDGTIAAVGHDEEDSDTIVVDCGRNGGTVERAEDKLHGQRDSQAVE